MNNSIGVTSSRRGLSQIQWMAGLAMQSLIAKTDGMTDSDSQREEIALWSYRMAQAMKAMETRLDIDDVD